MKIQTAQIPINKPTKMSFGSSYANSSPLEQNQSNNKEVRKANNNDKLLLALGALTLIVIGGLSYKKIHSAKKLKKTNSGNQNTITQSTFNLNNLIENLSKRVSKGEFCMFDDELKRCNLPNYNLTNSLKSNDSKNFVKYILAAKKLGLSNHIEFPKVLILDNINSKTKDISKIFVTALDSNFKSTKYTKGYMAEFVESLDEFSSNALKKYNEEQTHTFLHFDNTSEFLMDLKLKENEQFKTKFDKIIAKNRDNKIVYIIDNNAANQLNTDSILKFDFDEKINAADLAKDIEEVKFQLGSKLSSIVVNIDKELSEYIQPNGTSPFYALRNLLLDIPNEKVYIVNGKDKGIIEKAITLISSRTNNNFEKLDCNGVLGLYSLLAKKGEKAEELYQRTGKRTFLYLDDLGHTPNINDFVAIASEKYHIVPVLNSQNNEIISNLNLTKNQIFKMDFWGKGQKAVVGSMELMKDRMKKNDFSHINLERLNNEFFNLIAAERSGMSPPIKNGILLHGSDNLTRITVDAIKDTVDANYVKIAFNKDKPSDIIDKMIDEAEKAEKRFQDTRKRTVLELDGLDNLLTLDTNGPKNSDLINEFKSIAEDLSKKYHTTIIMRTDKSLEIFEKASIASNRLGMHIEVK